MNQYCSLENFVLENTPEISTSVIISNLSNWYAPRYEEDGLTIKIAQVPDREVVSLNATIKRSPKQGLLSPEEVELLAKEYGGEHSISVLGIGIFGGRYNRIDREEEVEHQRYHQRDTYEPLFRLLGISYHLTEDKLGINPKQDSLLLTPGTVKGAYALLCQNGEDPSLYNGSEERSFQVIAGPRTSSEEEWSSELHFGIGQWPYHQGVLTSEEMGLMEKTLQRHGIIFTRTAQLTLWELFKNIFGKGTILLKPAPRPFKHIVYTENCQDWGAP